MPLRTPSSSRSLRLGCLLALAGIVAACNMPMPQIPAIGKAPSVPGAVPSGAPPATDGSQPAEPAPASTTTSSSPASSAITSEAPAPACTSCANGPQTCPNLPCICNDKRIVNTKQCDNACCAPAEVACAASCKKHNGFSGSLAGGAPASTTTTTSAPSASPAEPKPALAAVGKTCKKDNDCASSLCLFRGKAQYGYCTKECQSFPDCPTFWKCNTVGNGSGKYCVQPKE